MERGAAADESTLMTRSHGTPNGTVARARPRLDRSDLQQPPALAPEACCRACNDLEPRLEPAEIAAQSRRLTPCLLIDNQ